MFLTVLHHPIVHGALSGALAAGAVDLHAFVTWKRFQDAATYDWGTATFRWAQGAVVGALAAGGLNLM